MLCHRPPVRDRIFGPRPRPRFATKSINSTTHWRFQPSKGERAGDAKRMLTTETFDSIFGTVIQGKPVLKDGQDRRDLPTYTIGETARYLGLSERTVSYWFCPKNRILRPSAYLGETALLSFRDLSEAYVLALLTKFYGFRMRSLQRIVADARVITGFDRPMIEADLKVVLGNVVFEDRRKRKRQMVDVAHAGNLVFPEFVDQVGRRILRDQRNQPSRIYPWRLVEVHDTSRPVSMDPDIVSGRLVVTGTRIPVAVLLGKRIRGRSDEDLAHAYQISTESVRKALLHIDRPIQPKAA
jgi:uncharacterized protein (DUF433 family)